MCELAPNLIRFSTRKVVTIMAGGRAGGGEGDTVLAVYTIVSETRCTNLSKMMSIRVAVD